MKTKIESYGDKATDFSNKDIHKLGYGQIGLVVILIGFILKKVENRFLQMFLKECKYIEKEKE